MHINGALNTYFYPLRVRIFVSHSLGKVIGTFEILIYFLINVNRRGYKQCVYHLINTFTT